MSALGRRGASGQERFAGEVLDRFRASPAISDSWYVPERFAIGYHRGGPDRSGWAYLGTLYAECAQAGEAEREERIARYVEAFTEPVRLPDGWDRARPLLRPVLRGVTTGRAGGSDRTDLVRRPVLPFLDELVVIDMPSAMGYLRTGMLADWGIGVDEVFAAARENLVDGADDAPVLGERPAMLRYLDGGDAYWSSHLLLDGWLAGRGKAVGGRPVAFVPDRDSLQVVSDEPALLAELLPLVEAEYREAARPVSPMMYTVDDAGAVVPYPAPPGHPLHDAVTRAELVLAGGEYDIAADALRAEHPRIGRTEATVASYLIADSGDGRPESVATWSGGRPTLLPEVDRVAVVGSWSRFCYLIRFTDLVDIMELAPVPGLHPARYLVDGWPDRSRRRRLFAVAERRPVADGTPR